MEQVSKPSGIFDGSNECLHKRSFVFPLLCKLDVVTLTEDKRDRTHMVVRFPPLLTVLNFSVYSSPQLKWGSVLLVASDFSPLVRRKFQRVPCFEETQTQPPS